jgi:hypothetical protein
MELTKAEAEAEAIRRWYLLPPHQRASCEDAQAYANRLDLELDFFAVTSRARLIGAWLIREFFRAKDAQDNDAIEAFRAALNEPETLAVVEDEIVMPPEAEEAA